MRDCVELEPLVVGISVANRRQDDIFPQWKSGRASMPSFWFELTQQWRSLLATLCTRPHASASGRCRCPQYGLSFVQSRKLMTEMLIVAETTFDVLYAYMIVPS
jgi:hypothetical protein